MEPIVVNSQLDEKQYFKINFGILLQRMKLVLPIAVILLLISFFTADPDYRDNSVYMWIGGWILVYLLFIWVLQYYKVKRNFKRNTSLGEVKRYELTDECIDIKGQTTSMTTEWQHVNKAIEKKDSFLVFAFNNKGVIFLPKLGFVNSDWDNFKSLIKTKRIKNNFK
jgi:hypothetical protein